ncbi:MAG: PAS domain-containing sensor histidine kinase, partial [Desulfovibrionaceae bacterium]|nr:PAS domain-containing sensor histidine kinase [Desulfovibrionaceae bacterium]
MNEDEQIIRIGQIDGRERRKRQLELYAAGAIAGFVAICTWLQLTFYGLDSWLFIFLFNINALLMLVVLFLVARSVVKLVIERRRNVFGARIRSRMVTIFVMLTL